jgi:hypothetical protein
VQERMCACSGFRRTGWKGTAHEAVRVETNGIFEREMGENKGVMHVDGQSRFNFPTAFISSEITS